MRKLNLHLTPVEAAVATAISVPVITSLTHTRNVLDKKKPMMARLAILLATPLVLPVLTVKAAPDMYRKARAL